MNLMDTVKWMDSDDYKERFLAEYHQLTIRIEKLEEALKADLPEMRRKVLRVQLSAMKYYQSVLRTRAILEEIEL